ncbi:hypothetical protein C7448_101802 [Tenacibaculum gallaicum]|uniref:MORN repeat protein n=1 Tax=Tenacibaculum gallaicum TaxID=561505 RepID=A0A3E0IE72_9FLAO|nr:hypothetical protein [Tenacibaculum gallaicum]REH56757.1 hypothetical protein C7448_101802 [Tenacibaculum gallaicum]
MKNSTLILFLFLCYNILGQTPEKIKPPAVLLNSLELKKEVRSGKNYYSHVDKRKLYDREYKIIIHTEVRETIIDTVPTIHSEGNDYDFGSHFKGKSIGIIEKGFFNKGYKNGLWKVTYKNKLVKTINYNNGLIIGRYRVYNAKGQLLYKTTFGSKGNGKYKDFNYSTGVLKEEGNYENGKKEGEWCLYNEQGSLIKKNNYKEGEFIDD